MTTQLIDCNDDPEKIVYTPFFAACFGLNEIPNSLRAVIGPVSSPCGCPCYGFPTVPTEVSAVRTTQCDWSSAGNVNWVIGGYGQPVVLFIAPYQNLYQNNASINPITNVWQLGNAITTTGSCSYDETTRTTTGQISGVVQFEPDCACPDPCLLPVTIYFGA